MSGLSLLSRAQSRSISPENFNGEKGKGGMATDGSAAKARRASLAWVEVFSQLPIASARRIKPRRHRSPAKSTNLDDPT